MEEKSSKGLQSQKIGALGEQIACKYLVKRGHVIEERNFRRRCGEIDIISVYKNVVHFTEVKTIEVVDFSRERSHEPEDLVDRRKLRNVARTASLYMDRRNGDIEYQIDVIAVLLNQATMVARCKVIEQALEDNL